MGEKVGEELARFVIYGQMFLLLVIIVVAISKRLLSGNNTISSKTYESSYSYSEYRDGIITKYEIPNRYYVELENGDKYEVESNEWHEYSIGDKYKRGE